MVEEALQIAEKRSEKQRRKERYIQLSAEFRRIAGRGKNAFLSEQCKEIEENNRMRKTRIVDTKRTFHAKTGTIKDKDGMDLREAEYKKR